MPCDKRPRRNRDEEESGPSHFDSGRSKKRAGRGPAKRGPYSSDTHTRMRVARGYSLETPSFGVLFNGEWRELSRREATQARPGATLPSDDQSSPTYREFDSDYHTFSSHALIPTPILDGTWIPAGDPLTFPVQHNVNYSSNIMNYPSLQLMHPEPAHRVPGSVQFSQSQSMPSAHVSRSYPGLYSPSSATDSGAFGWVGTPIDPMNPRVLPPSSLYSPPPTSVSMWQYNSSRPITPPNAQREPQLSNISPFPQERTFHPRFSTVPNTAYPSPNGMRGIFQPINMSAVSSLSTSSADNSINEQVFTSHDVAHQPLETEELISGTRYRLSNASSHDTFPHSQYTSSFGGPSPRTGTFNFDMAAHADNSSQYLSSGVNNAPNWPAQHPQDSNYFSSFDK
ncbi:hypothetical protein FISHEDRAFT_70628 [Fistulina hepatica ATCC 64428]|uniref:Uncharacterized protein n=1 Tax=Fistulina hepatica ATCC 64428 TaxID=1128425 RepID=A0A0D7AIR0_9AGAR|nr:hypothetical protein FISHEDRAFT_70628 [Fistulina hepatica ATCC 64428]